METVCPHCGGDLIAGYTYCNSCCRRAGGESNYELLITNEDSARRPRLFLLKKCDT